MNFMSSAIRNSSSTMTTGGIVMNDSTMSAIFNPKGGSIAEGVVVGSDVGLNSCLVLARDGNEYVCAMMTPVASDTFGYSCSMLPKDGTRVLVYTFGNGSRSGFVLGCIPGVNSVRNAQLPDEGKNFVTDPEVGVAKSPPYESVMENPHYTKKLIAISNGYVNMIPGDFSITNENDVGVAGEAMTAYLKGGPVSVQASMADATVRIVSSGFQTYSAIRSEEEFSDNNFVNRERSAMMHMSERLGVDIGAEPYIEQDSPDPHAPYWLQNKEKKQTAKARRRTFEGHEANIYQDFIFRPDPDIPIMAMTKDPLDRGVYHGSIDSSGSMLFRTAGGIAIERYDRIPVPFRKFAHWDPNGDKTEEKFETEKFEWNKEAPGYRRLELDDALAWDLKNAYMGFEEAHKKDFYVPEETDLKPLEDDTRITGKTKDLSKHDKRRAGIYIGDDGSVILRDAWGSEISMVGGVVTVSAASNIHILPGKSAVIMAGDDAIVKAKNSVDITATKKDLRLKAEVNMELVSGSDSGEDPRRGAILIESKSENIGQPIKGKGESAAGSGIFLKSEKSFVAIGAKRTHIHSEEMATYFSKEMTLIGSEENILINADEMIETGVNTSAMVLTSSFAGLLSTGSALVGGEGSACIINGDQVPAIWVPIDSPPTFEFIDEIVDVVTDVKTYKPYDTESTEDCKFTFRTSDEYGTSSPFEIGASGFAFYQPYWVIAKNEGSKLLNSISIDNWEESKIDDEIPWPGSDVSGDSYITVTPQNISDMISIDRKSLKNSSNTSKSDFLDSYEVAKV